MSKPGYRILIVDDEPDIIEFLSYNLTKEGYEVDTATNGRRAIEKATEFSPDLILLDVMMPDMDGIETCQELRANPLTKDCLIAFLTARSEDYSQIAGFDAGGDDYISKPIKPKVLISRIKALLKRSGSLEEAPEPTPEIPEEGIYINRERYLVYLDGRELVLPKKEFELLALLQSKPQKVFTRDEIYQAIWGDDIVVGDRTIDVHIRKLREKLGDQYIRTVKGVGYKFTV
ncbi:MAG TPA: response regulator transcription factor [Tenuifilaceae bacterium]|jgi:two-component system alkaline phosphatase synthesis response regulator PhoP|nr:response regulator transcription factor [Bacteroidales bacterium]HNY09798.1 response regulator transcription factor [Tenuifilaceae bacterium]MBP8642734.1 response regulator transcription factor [Bacteroidales bacterium]NLI87840.1 response regulator transcription factor [Bacteroidales bacterium]HOA08899.1 response regulator transcription factor [Tenuifilaceae bacterium]